MHPLISLCLGLTLAMNGIFAGSAVAAAKADETVALNDHGRELAAKYERTLSQLKTEIAAALPQVDPAKRDAFMKMYVKEGPAFDAMSKSMGTWRAQRYKAKVEHNPKIHEAATAVKQRIADEFDAMQLKILATATPLLDDLDSFLSSDRLDDKLVRCAFLVEATPRRLAAFAQENAANESLVAAALADVGLQRQMLIAGGASGRRYDQALAIYDAIRKTGPRAAGGLFQRLALATALELAVPVKHFDLDSTVDPIKRYQHYEQAQLSGELDPHFEKFTVWEYRMVVNSNATDEQLAWGRAMLRTYRPDMVRAHDYSAIVASDVVYQSPQWTSSPRTYQQIINGGGKCGPRAWFGRFSLQCFGIPIWGVQQVSHAAVGMWTPSGWTVGYGHPLRYSWWQGESGSNFLIDATARNDAEKYLKVMRAQWISDALGEEQANAERHTGGGFWNVLGRYEKMRIVHETGRREAGAVNEALAEANVSDKTDKAPVSKISQANRKIVNAADGSITMPGGACTQPAASTAKIELLDSFAGGSQLNYNRLGMPEPFTYAVDVSKAGRYNLTMRVVTVNLEQHVILWLNQSPKSVDVALPYTVGVWGRTEPVELTLAEGRNTLTFTRNSPNNGFAIHELKLSPVTRTPAKSSADAE